jgi:hypothetical protein
MKRLTPIAALFVLFSLLIALAPFNLASASPGIISEPSFETVAQWTYSTNDDYDDVGQSSAWATQGTYSYKLANIKGKLDRDGYCQILQSVDFTKLDTISFDCNLSATKALHFEARVFVGATQVWSKAVPASATVYLHEEIDVSGYTGSYDLIFRIYNVDKPGVMIMTCYFDNIKTWGSFSNSGHTTVCNTFVASTPDLYMYGENFEEGTYHVGIYDADGYKAASDGTWTTDTLSIQYQLNSDPGRAAGTWHAVVYKAPNTPPTTYVADDPARVVEDSFTVEQSAIPEFPTAFVAIGVVGFCGVGYLWLRRRHRQGRSQN